MWKIYKSSGGGQLDKKELLKDLRIRLIKGEVKIEEMEKLINEYYEWRPRNEQEQKGNNQLGVIESEEKKRNIETLQK